MWSKASCLRNQHDGKDWTANHRPSDLKFNALTATPPRPRALAGLSSNAVSVPKFCETFGIWMYFFIVLYFDAFFFDGQFNVKIFNYFLLSGTPITICGRIHTTQVSRLSPGFSPDNKEVTR